MKFQPIIKWSGSKRALSEEILSHFPQQIDTYYEPFCGSCSMLFQLMHSEIAVNKYVCSDINEDLIEFFKKVKTDPQRICEEYKKRWTKLTSYKTIKDKQIYYNKVRQSYNLKKNVYDFIFLTRTSANGLIRYNSKGEFNAPFHLTRDGIKPETFASIIQQWSDKLNEKQVEFIHLDYSKIKPKKGDYLFLDPPYANTKAMYFGTLDFGSFWEWLRTVDCQYSLTFDGTSGLVDNTYNVPTDVYSNHLYLKEKISSFKNLHNKVEEVRESLYIKNNFNISQERS